MCLQECHVYIHLHTCCQCLPNIGTVKVTWFVTNPCVNVLPEVKACYRHTSTKMLITVDYKCMLRAVGADAKMLRCQMLRAYICVSFKSFYLLPI